MEGNNLTAAAEPGPPNPGEFEFNRRLLLNVLAYSVMFVVGTIGNAVVFVAAYRQHVSPENQVGRESDCGARKTERTCRLPLQKLLLFPGEISWVAAIIFFFKDARCLEANMIL